MHWQFGAAWSWSGACGGGGGHDFGQVGAVLDLLGRSRRRVGSLVDGQLAATLGAISATE